MPGGRPRGPCCARRAGCLRRRAGGVGIARVARFPLEGRIQPEDQDDGVARQRAVFVAVVVNRAHRSVSGRIPDREAACFSRRCSAVVSPFCGRPRRPAGALARRPTTRRRCRRTPHGPDGKPGSDRPPGTRRGGEPPACGDGFYSALILMERRAVRASSVFGTEMLSTPFLKVAFTFDSSMPEGSAIERWKRP